MRRRAPAGTGFFLSFLINFIFRYEWGILTVLLAVVRLFLKFPLVIVFIPLIIWVIHALVVTTVFSLIARWASGPFEERPNINPYSTKNGKSGASGSVNGPLTVEATEVRDGVSGVIEASAADTDDKA